MAFEGLALESLTAFVVFVVDARKDGASAQASFTCKLPVTGLPQERLDRIVKSVIKDRRGLLSYLRRLLTGLDGGLLDADIGQDRMRGRGGRNGASTADPVLLENIVRCLRRDPSRLRAIDRTLSRLTADGAEPEGKAIVPDDFLELWSVVRELVPPSPGDESAVSVSVAVSVE